MLVSLPKCLADNKGAAEPCVAQGMEMLKSTLGKRGETFQAAETVQTAAGELSKAIEAAPFSDSVKPLLAPVMAKLKRRRRATARRKVSWMAAARRWRRRGDERAVAADENGGMGKGAGEGLDHGARRGGEVATLWARRRDGRGRPWRRPRWRVHAWLPARRGAPDPRRAPLSSGRRRRTSGRRL